MQAQTCPVCQGTGEKTVGFYTQASIRDGTPTPCRTCNGRGIVFVPSEPFVLPDPTPVRRYTGPARMDTAGTITGDGEVPVS